MIENSENNIVEIITTIEVSNIEAMCDIIVSVLLKNSTKVLKKLFINDQEIELHNMRYNINRFIYDTHDTIKIKC